MGIKHHTAHRSAAGVVMLGLLALVLLAAASLVSPVAAPAEVQLAESWGWQRPLPHGDAVVDLRFVDAQHGWALTDATMLRTKNGGRSWTELPSAASLRPTAMTFVDAATGWVVASESSTLFGTVSVTTDGGDTWARQLTTRSTESFGDIVTTDGSHLWALGSLNGVVCRSSDGGKSWDHESPLPDADYGARRPVAIHFAADNLHGCVVGSAGAVWYTGDGGLTWSPAKDFGEATTAGLEDVFVADASSAWAVGSDGTIVHSENGGLTWASQPSGTSSRLTAIGFADSRGWIVGGDGTVLTSSDGHAWTGQSSDSARTLESLAVVTGTTAWAGASDGSILQTTSAAGPWTTQSGGAEPDLLAICLGGSSETTAWAVGREGRILHTVDGGASWTEQHRGGNDLTGVSFYGWYSGWAVGMSGSVYGTIDAGAHWTLQELGLGVDLADVEATGSTTAVAVGSGGSIFVFDGTSWSPRSSGVTAGLRAVDFVSAQTGWAVGEDGTVLCTHDGGATWERQTLPPPPGGLAQHVNDVDFVDAQEGWCAGDNGMAYRTENGGQSWMWASPFENGSADHRFASVLFLKRSDILFGFSGVWLATAGGTANGHVYSASGTGAGWSHQHLAAGALGVTDMAGTTVLTLFGRARVWAVGGDGMIAAGTDADDTPPATSHDAPVRWSNRDVTVTFSPVDAGCGVWLTQWRQGLKGWQFTSSATLPAPADHTGDGVHTLSFFSTDRMGNEEASQSCEVKIDTSPPVSTDDADLLWHRAKTVGFLASDPPGWMDVETSGVWFTEYTVDGKPWTTSNVLTMRTGKRGLNTGDHAVAYRSVDMAGNVEQYHWCHIMLDGKPPVTTDNAPADLVKGDYTLELTPTDPHSGPAHTYLSVDGGEWEEATSKAFIATPAPTTYQVAYYSTDNVGNREVTRTCSLTIMRVWLPWVKAKLARSR